MIRQKKYFLILLILGFYFANSQSKDLDSIYTKILTMPDTSQKVDTLLQLNKISKYTRPDFVEKALETAEKIYDITGIAKAYNAKGYMSRRNNRFLKSVEYYKRALGFLEKSKDTMLKMIVLNNLGSSLRKLNDEKTAYKYYMQGLDLAKKSHNEPQMARILNGIGNVFVNTEEYKKALYYFKKSLEIELKNNNLKGQEYNFANIGEAYIYTKQYDSAEYYLKKSLDIAKTIYHPKEPGIEYNLLGYLYKNKGDFVKAIYYYDLAIPILEKQNIKRYVANSYINRGLSKLAFKKFKLAKQDIAKGLQIAKSIKSKENISLGYDALVQYFTALKDYKSALSAHIMAKKYHDSIVNVSAKNSIISNQILYETKEKDEKIKQLAYEKEQEKLASTRNFWLMIGIAIFSLVMLSFLYLFFSLRRKNKDLELEQKNSEIQNYILKIKDLEQKMQHKGHDEIDLDVKLKEMDLTKREIDVLKLIAEGYTNDQIAEKMFISKNTVKSHIKNIYLKLDVKNRIQVLKKIRES